MFIYSKCLQRDQNIYWRTYLTYQAFHVACTDFKDGNYSNTLTAALFASALLDPPPQQERPFHFLLTSQVCLILATYSLFHLEDGFKAADHLITSMKERSCKIQKCCPEEWKDQLQMFLYYEKYLVRSCYHCCTKFGT